jgi:hypothetical protein
MYLQESVYLIMVGYIENTEIPMPTLLENSRTYINITTPRGNRGIDFLFIQPPRGPAAACRAAPSAHRLSEHCR